MLAVRYFIIEYVLKTIIATTTFKAYQTKRNAVSYSNKDFMH